MPPVTAITIVYDDACGFCASTRNWIASQAPLVEISFVASGSREARAKFPWLPAGDLAVVANTGEVWTGNSAWIVCLWALRGYRDLAVRLSGPLLLLLAREAFSVLSRNRAALSALLAKRSQRELEQELRNVSAPLCKIETK